MLEISPNVFIDTSFPGMTLGLINYAHGLILIDAPFRLDDIRIWRGSMQSISRGSERLLVNLDEHFDRTLGAHQIDCMVAAQDKMTQLIKDRPVTFKPQVIETGAEWEMHNSLVSTRWATPEITFSDRLEIHWDVTSLLLESHPGPSTCAIWAILPTEKVVFVGDAVIPDAPPFLANADLPVWKETLSLLLKPEYKHFSIVSGRSGVITQNEVKAQLKIIEKIENQIEKISEKQIRVEDLNKTVHNILKHFDIPKTREQQYLMRVQWGLAKYLRKQFGTTVETTQYSLL